MLENLWGLVKAEPGFYLLFIICTISFFYGIKVTTRWVLEDNLLAFLGMTLCIFAGVSLYLIMLNTEADDRLAYWLGDLLLAILERYQ